MGVQDRVAEVLGCEGGVSKPKKLKLTSAEIREALEKSYGLEAVLVFEVPDATGHRNKPRRIDAIAVGCWPSRGLYLHAIEIKVSRGDFLRELKDPEKAETLVRNCDCMFIAAPKGMVKPAELPETWGLLEVSDAGKVYKTKAATVSTRETPDHGFYVALVRAVVEQRSEKKELEAIRSKANGDAWARAEKHFEDDRDRLMDALKDAREKLHEFQSMAGRFGRLNPSDVGRMLDAIQSLKGDYGALNSMGANAQKIVDEVDAIKTAAKAIFDGPPAP